MVVKGGAKMSKSRAIVSPINHRSLWSGYGAPVRLFAAPPEQDLNGATGVQSVPFPEQTLASGKYHPGLEDSGQLLKAEEGLQRARHRTIKKVTRFHGTIQL